MKRSFGVVRRPAGNPAAPILSWKVLALAAGCLQIVPSYPAEQGTDSPPVTLRVDAAAREAAAARVFTTIEAALDAAREAKRLQPSSQVRIEIAEGDYYLNAPLRIDAGLSGKQGAPTQIVAASAKAPPRLSAGRRLRLEWRPYRLKDKRKAGAVRAAKN
jgi:pectin methylesterase-like acyl-CoA thioesterase